MSRPVLLIHFNRPETTRRQLEALRAVAPERIWLLCDGPRPDVVGDAERVAEVRTLLNNIPWKCETKKLYRDQNFGCFKNISEGISWFLSDCNAGVILEDDILPDPSFFEFCDVLLDRYQDASEVYAISGQHGVPEPLQVEDDYGFTNYFDCWGWATWKRAWDHFDPEMTAWRDRSTWRAIKHRVLKKYRAQLYWDIMFRLVDRGRRDSWAYRYLLTIWKHEGCTLVPRLNLTSNVGFNHDATQTAHLRGREYPIHRQSFPLNHPEAVAVNPVIDRYYEDVLCSKSLAVRARWFWGKMSNALKLHHG